MAPPTAPQIWLRPLTSTGAIKFWWYPPVDDGGSSITGYTLTDGTITIDNISPGSVDPNVFRIYTVDSLTDGQDYTFSLIAHNADGDSPPATFRTVQPGGKATITQNATYNFINSSNALVEWEAPADTGGSTIRWYVIQISDGVTTIKKSAHGYDRQLLVKNLDQTTSYTVQVNAVNDAAYAPAATATNITPTSYGITIQNISSNPADINVSVTYDLVLTGIDADVYYYYYVYLDSTVINEQQIKSLPGISTLTLPLSFTSPSTGGAYQMTAELYDINVNPQVLVATATPITFTVTPGVPTFTIQGSGNPFQTETISYTIAGSGSPYTYDGDEWFIDSVSQAVNTNSVWSNIFGAIGRYIIGYTITTTEYGPISASSIENIAPLITTDFQVGIYDTITPNIGESTNFYVTQSYTSTPSDAQWYLDNNPTGETGPTYSTTFNDTNTHYVKFSVVIDSNTFESERTVIPVGPIIAFVNVSPDPVNPNSTVTYDLDFAQLFAETEYHISGDYTDTFTTGVGETTKSFTGLTVTSPSDAGSTFVITITLNNSSDVYIISNTYIVSINPIPSLSISWDQSQPTKQNDTIQFTIDTGGASYTAEGDDEWLVDNTSVAIGTSGAYSNNYSDIGRFTLSYNVTTTEFGVLTASAIVSIVPNITYDTLTPTVDVPTNFYVTQAYTVTPTQVYWILDSVTTDPLETGSTYTVTFTDTDTHTVAYSVDSDYLYIYTVTVNPVNP